jgi:hypothetical protein
MTAGLREKFHRGLKEEWRRLFCAIISMIAFRRSGQSIGAWQPQGLPLHLRLDKLSGLTRRVYMGEKR